jgi:hypothetical protein
MKARSILQYAIMIAVVMGFSIVGVELVIAQPTPGMWELYPIQEASYSTLVQEPIKADGSSNFKSTGKSVIPIKFNLFTSPGPVILQSILSDSDGANDYSFLSFTPGSPLTFNEIKSLTAVYNFTEGNCHGGALRWSIRVSETESVFIYYGGYPNFTDCTTVVPAINQSGLNMIGKMDARYDTSQVAGGTFYDTYAHAQALVGNRTVVRVSLVLDGGWTIGDQVVNLVNVLVNENAFVPESDTPTETCDLPPAEIQITKVSGASAGPVNEPISIQPSADDVDFRIVDCKYMYNLATSSLSGPGRYKVEALIDGIVVQGAAYFDLR